jgi:hypothetical protein
MASIYLLPRNEFAYRRNGDRTTDSICLVCFATVACAPSEETLKPAEAAHDCWQKREAVLKRLPLRTHQA